MSTNNTASPAQSLTPQQRLRRRLPRQRRFTVELAGQAVQQHFRSLRRTYLLLAVALLLAASWLASARPWFAVIPAARLTVPLLGLLLLVTGPLTRGRWQAVFHPLFFLVGFACLGVGAGLWLEHDRAALWNLSWLLGLPVLGHALNSQLPGRGLPAAWQFLLAGPWLAAALVLAWLKPASPWLMGSAGLAGLLLVFCEVLTLRRVMALRTGSQALLAAADILPATVAGLYRLLSGTA